MFKTSRARLKFISLNFSYQHSIVKTCSFTNMASGTRLHVYADFLNRYTNLISFRTTKVVNNGWNNLGPLTGKYSTSVEPVVEERQVQQPVEEKRINKAVRAYLERAKEYDIFLKEQVKEFEKGRKFLARIMGKNPDAFTQSEIDEAISYLFPSGLHEPLARPMLKHPDILFAKRKEAQFDYTGRPYHYLFYTTKPNFTQALHECAAYLYNLNEKVRQMGPKAVHPKVPLNIAESQWMSKTQLEEKLLENLLDIEYEKFIEAFDRLSIHPYSFEAAPFIMQFRIMKAQKYLEFKRPQVVLVREGVYSVQINECRRKKCTGTVTLINPGTGKLSINGKNLIDFFEDLQPRQEAWESLIR